MELDSSNHPLISMHFSITLLQLNTYQEVEKCAPTHQLWYVKRWNTILQSQARLKALSQNGQMFALNIDSINLKESLIKQKKYTMKDLTFIFPCSWYVFPMHIFEYHKTKNGFLLHIELYLMKILSLAFLQSSIKPFWEKLDNTKGKSFLFL